MYKSIDDGIAKLIRLFNIVSNDPVAYSEPRSQIKLAVAHSRWEVMGPVYDNFFHKVARGMPIVDASKEAEIMAKEMRQQYNTDLIKLKPQRTLSTICAVNIVDAKDSRVQLFRPKSLRDQTVYGRQWSMLREQGVDGALHGGRRSIVRMLQAIQTGAKIRPIAFLTTETLANAVIICERYVNNESSNNITESEHSLSAPVYIASNDLLNTIRGQKLNAGDAILAIIQFPIASELCELLSRPPILILDNVRNAENVGSILRIALCLGITSIVASEAAWAALKDSRAARCSMGTMYYHRYYKAGNREHNGESGSLWTTIRDIRMAGICVYGIEIGETAQAIAPHRSNRNWAAVLGNEDVGLSNEAISSCDHIVFIPQVHGDSLNVGHAAAIALYELGKDSVSEHDGLACCT